MSTVVDRALSPPDLQSGKTAHIIRKKDEMRGYMMGEEVEALCGHRFIPTREPYQYPVCDACKAALNALSEAEQ